MSVAEMIAELPKLSLQEKQEVALAICEAIEDEIDIAAADVSYQRYLDGAPTIEVEVLFRELGL